MLKARIIPVILFNRQVIVKSVGFERWRNVGNPINVVRVYNSREVDELIFLDVTASKQGQSPDLDLLYDIAEECFMPLTVGGGITSLEDIRNVLKAGADKVCINSAALENLTLVGKAAYRFGSQCVVAAVDVKKDEKGEYKVYRHIDRRLSDLDPFAWIRQLELSGAGEILVTAVDRDGTMEGYDTALIRRASDHASVPVIACGGAGKLSDFVDVVNAGASAAGAASIFHFTQHTPLEVKSSLRAAGIQTRI